MHAVKSVAIPMTSVGRSSCAIALGPPYAAPHVVAGHLQRPLRGQLRSPAIRKHPVENGVAVRVHGAAPSSSPSLHTYHYGSTGQSAEVHANDQGVSTLSFHGFLHVRPCQCALVSGGKHPDVPGP